MLKTLTLRRFRGFESYRLADLARVKLIVGNVQVFATTHSYDCIRGLGTLLRAHPELAGQVAIHKLDQSLPQAVTLQGARIPVAVEQDLEVR